MCQVGGVVTLQAPDDIGMRAYARHVHWTKNLVRGLDLKGITLFGQDWGSLIGLRVATELEPRVARMLILPFAII